MDSQLKPGLEHEVSYIVEAKHLADFVGSGLVQVFSTAMMIGGMESAAVAAVQSCLDKGKTTVGVHVDVSHKAPTPLGMRTRFHAKLLEISANGKSLLFEVKAFDEVGLIGEGKHRRVIVDKEEFENSARGKKNLQDCVDRNLRIR